MISHIILDGFRVHLEGRDLTPLWNHLGTGSSAKGDGMYLSQHLTR